jgi:D-glycero-alpha-D-manno-heptose-7-phosphate kinase
MYGGTCVNIAINIRQEIIMNDINEWNLKSYDSEIFFKTIIHTLSPGYPLGVKHIFRGEIESGLGTSAALAVALVNAANKFGNVKMTKSELAEKAREIEVDNVDLFTGIQDQYASSYGGANILDFKNGNVNVHPISRDVIDPIRPYLILFHTGFKRQAARILDNYKSLTPNSIRALDNLNTLAHKGIYYIMQKDIYEIARTLKLSWEMKKESNPLVSSSFADEIYQYALSVGAMAGKLCGAGGGGYMLFIVEPSKQNAFKYEMAGKGLRHVDFSIDWNGADCRIL